MTAGAVYDYPLQLEIFRSIREVSAADWDRTVAYGHLFHTHRFLRVIEDAHVEGSDFWYLLFWRGSTPVASGALSAFTVSLDLFASPSLQAFSKRVRRLMPRFLQIRVLFNGLPISIGHHNLEITNPALATEVIGHVCREMRSIASKLGIRFVVAKEFRRRDRSWSDQFLEAGFFGAPSLPYVSMPIRWNSYSDYLSSLRHHYRRLIRRSTCRLKDPCRVRVVSLARESPLGPAVLFRMYLDVMKHATVRLETLNHEFFAEFLRLMKNEARLAVVEGPDGPIAWGLLTESESVMTFVLVGMDYDRRDSCAAYHNLLHTIVKLAIETGCTRLDLGQTSYWTKQQLGGVSEKMVFYFQALQPVMHAVLKMLRQVIFPAYRPGSIRPFRTTDGCEGDCKTIGRVIAVAEPFRRPTRPKVSSATRIGFS